MSTMRKRFTIGAGLAVGTGLAGRFGATRAVHRWEGTALPYPLSDFDLTATTHEITTADGGIVHAWESGTGPTFVLGHGIAGHHADWNPVAKRLVGQGHRVVTFDQRGHGRSTPGRAGFGLEGLALDVAAVVDHFATDEPVLLAGHSMGGIGIQALTRHSPATFAKVRAVGLVSTMAANPGIPLGKAVASAKGLQVYRFLLAQPTTARVLMRTGFGTPAPPLAWVDRLHQDWNDCPDETLLGLGPALSTFDLRADVPSFPVPVHIVCGDHDRTTPLKLSDEIHALVPGSTITVVPGAGHMIIWERPDVVTAQLVALGARPIEAVG